MAFPATQKLYYGSLSEMLPDMFKSGVATTTHLML